MSNKATHGGKGSKQRPTKDQKKFDNNWDAIFGKKDKPSAVDDAADVNSEYINYWLKKPPEEKEEE